MSQNMRLLLRVICGLLLVAGVGIVSWMAMGIGRGNVESFRKWNSMYDYAAIGGIAFSCVLLGILARNSSRRLRLSLLALGVVMVAGGVCGHYGFQMSSNAILEPIPPTKQFKPDAASTVLGYHYECPESGGYVAFGNGVVKFVDRDQFATLQHASSPDQTPEFVSPTKTTKANASQENSDGQQGANALSRAQKRMEHANNLKKMAVDHIQFLERDGICVPLKPEHFKSYPGMTADLRNAITDGTYVWYFGWEPIVSYRSEKSRALWYDFASWASVYLASFGAGLLIAGFILSTRHRQTQ